MLCEKLKFKSYQKRKNTLFSKYTKKKDKQNKSCTLFRIKDVILNKETKIKIFICFFSSEEFEENFHQESRNYRF